jgi:hypothetical protein
MGQTKTILIFEANIFVFLADDLFVVTNNGDIIKSKTDKNPCRIVNTWKCDNPRGR